MLNTSSCLLGENLQDGSASIHRSTETAGEGITPPFLFFLAATEPRSKSDGKCVVASNVPQNAVKNNICRISTNLKQNEAQSVRAVNTQGS